MSQIPKPADTAPPVQASLDSEMTDLEHQARALLRQVALERPPVDPAAHSAIQRIIRKAYALGGRAEFAAANGEGQGDAPDIEGQDDA